MSAGIYMSAQKNIANGLHFELVVRGLTLQKRNLSCNAKKIHLRCELPYSPWLLLLPLLNARYEARQAGSIIFYQQRWMYTGELQPVECHGQDCGQASVGVPGLTGQPLLPSHAEGLLQAATA